MKANYACQFIMEDGSPKLFCRAAGSSANEVKYALESQNWGTGMSGSWNVTED